MRGPLGDRVMNWSRGGNRDSKAFEFVAVKTAQYTIGFKENGT
jgi:hypothetical protein